MLLNIALALFIITVSPVVFVLLIGLFDLILEVIIFIGFMVPKVDPAKLEERKVNEEKTRRTKRFIGEIALFYVISMLLFMLFK